MNPQGMENRVQELKFLYIHLTKNKHVFERSTRPNFWSIASLFEMVEQLGRGLTENFHLKIIVI